MLYNFKLYLDYQKVNGHIEIISMQLLTQFCIGKNSCIFKEKTDCNAGKPFIKTLKKAAKKEDIWQSSVNLYIAGETPEPLELLR